MMELVTCKGRYLPGEPVGMLLRCDEAADMAEITVTLLAEPVWNATLPLTPPETAISLPPLAQGGYGVTARLMHGGEPVATVTGAANVGGDMVRYGFLCDFLPHDDSDVDCLAKYHIDHVQYYDWSYRHDTLVAPTEEFTDMMGKRNSLPVIRQKIAACRARGMKSMAYTAVYAACRAFWQQHPQWGLYAGADRPMTFIDTFYYMDIESPWREHLFAQYVEAVQKVGFDGFHMDTYGEPKRALTKAGEARALEAALPAMIRDADAALRKADIPPHLIFNNVGAWPVAATCTAPQDAVYMELWPPMDRYRHLKQAVMQALPGGKPVVLAAYPAPFRTDTPQRALQSELFLSFAIALAGATQLFMGEEEAVVTQGYYADYTRLAPWQGERMKAYQDFTVRFQDLLFDRALTDVSMTHAQWDNREYGCNVPYSLEGEPGKLWLTLRESGNRKLIGLINLHGVQDDCWNTGKETPTPLTEFVLQVLVLRPVQKVWFATPDAAGGEAVALEWNTTQTDYGLNVEIRVPELTQCGLVWLECE